MTVTIIQGDSRDVLPTLEAGRYQAIVTSPPYWGLRDYGVPGQLGLEPTPELYVASIVEVMRAARRVLRDDGVLWLNIGDSYATCASTTRAPGGKNREVFRPALAAGAFPMSQPNRMRHAFESAGIEPDELVGIPWMTAFALRADGWRLRADIIWSKPNPTPESTRTRPTKAHEYVFLFTKSREYFYDIDAIREPHVDPRSSKNGRTKLRGNLDSVERWYNPAGRNKRSVWTIATEPYPGDFYAKMPEELAKVCILAGTSERGRCRACGAPWRRCVESTRLVDGAPAEGLGAWRSTDKGRPERKGPRIGNYRRTTSRTTVGWEASCACQAGEPVPCEVLDPFGGVGTTGRVAERLGRHSTLVELNPATIALARTETAQLGLFAGVERDDDP